jgi:uncharacterized membrane protein
MSLALPVLFIGGVMAIAPFVGQWLTTVLAVPLVAWGLWQMRPQRADRRVAADHRA